MPSVDQITLQELQEAHRRGDHDQVTAWRRAGQLDDLLAGVASDEVDEEPEAPPAPVGDADQGARGGGPQGPISDAELKAMYARREYREISRARREGRLDGLLGTR